MNKTGETDMMCTFFGHKDAPSTPILELEEIIRKLITEYNVSEFFVGHQGSFDRMVQSVLYSLQREFSHIACRIVLAYLPSVAKKEKDIIRPFPTIYPEGLESIPPRFAIVHRNRWMIRRANYVVAYATCSYGGTAQAINYAKARGKKIVFLRS